MGKSKAGQTEWGRALTKEIHTNIIAQIQKSANTKNTKLHVGKSKAGQTEWGRAAVGGGASRPLHSPALSLEHKHESALDEHKHKKIGIDSDTKEKKNISEKLHYPASSLEH